MQLVAHDQFAAYNLLHWQVFLLLYLVNFGDDFFTEKLSTKNPIYKKNVLR